MINPRDVIKILGGSSLEQNQDSGLQPATRLENNVKSRRSVIELLGYEKKPFITHWKAILSGDFVEVYHYEIPVVKNIPPSERNPLTIPADRSEEYSKRTGVRRRFKVKRIIQTNFREYFKFMTFTLKDSETIDVRNVDQCVKYFLNFLRRLKYRYPKLRYVWVIEFQDKNGRGAVHFHVVCDVPYIRKVTLCEWWGAGWVKINRRTLGATSGYMDKYLSKSVDDPRLKGKRAYSSSLGLKQPITLYGYEAESLIKEIKDLKPDYKKAFPTENNGQCSYFVYNTAKPAPKDQQ